jgi:hypothetical protein
MFAFGARTSRSAHDFEADLEIRAPMRANDAA